MTGLGILNPAGALAAVAVGVLVALYLRERRRRVVPVASLFLWRQLPADETERRRFHVDPLFLLQLALLLALVGGYLRPYLEAAAGPAAGARLLLVLDVSASMQAREDGGTRFDLTRRRADALVGDLGSTDEVMLIAAGARAEVVLRWTTDHPHVRDRLEALEPLDTPTDLAPALELALGEAAARAGTRVALFTDLPPETSGLAPEALAAVDWVQIGRTDDNLAIASLRVEEPPFHPAREATVTVVVRNYGHARRDVALEARVGDELWTRRELVLEPRAMQSVPLAGPPGGGVVTVTLVADDALPVDDRAVGWIPPDEPLDVLLVSDSRALAADLRTVATSIAGARLESIDPAHYGDALPITQRTVVFDGFVPDVPPAVNALYVLPPPGNDVCPSARRLEDAAVVDWEAEEPVLDGMDGLGGLAVAHAAELVTPSWGTTAVVAAAGRTTFPMLVAGERDGHRTACLGAELVPPLASSDGLPLLLLTLGTLRWLEEPYGGRALTVETGLPRLAGPGAQAPVSGPHPGALRIAGDPAVLLVERTGVYRVGPPDDERLVLANLFDDRESDIGRDGAAERPATAPRSAIVRAVRAHEFGWWLYLAGALLLVTEWLVWRRRARA